jgi:hypothetical protein
MDDQLDQLYESIEDAIYKYQTRNNREAIDRLIREFGKYHEYYIVLRDDVLVSVKDADSYEVIRFKKAKLASYRNYIDDIRKSILRLRKIVGDK